jgi:DNA polymerase theta
VALRGKFCSIATNPASVEPRLILCIRALLEVIATKLATSKLAIRDYIQKTLLFHTLDHDELYSLVKSTLDGLLEKDLISVNSSATFEPTTLGQAIVASSLTPEDGVFIHRELKKAVQAFVMDGELHVLYTFTPVQSIQTEINWQIFRKEIESLDESGIRVLGFVGIRPVFVNRM